MQQDKSIQNILSGGVGFKVKFSMKDYMDLSPVHLLKNTDNIINYEHRKKGDIEKCIWTKEAPDSWEVRSKNFQEQEAERVLRDGAWIAIKDQIVWLPPNYYFALKYGKAGNDNVQFRLKRLKQVYFKLRARSNPGCMGTYTVKNRQDGETTWAVTDAFWECLDGNLSNGQIGIQSKTRNDAFNPCWRTMQMLWLGLPRWFKDLFCSDFVSGDKIEEKMKFQREADAMGDGGRNILLSYFPSVHNAMDGLNNMVKCILDEINKWKECSFLDTFTNYKKFIMPGFERKGLFDIFSSPADVNGKWNDEAFSFWKDSNPDEIVPETGCTKSRILRYYSDPLEGIQGAYDIWGDADPNRIHDHIMQERKNAKPEKLMGEIRGFPLNEEEMFGSFDAQNIWDNVKGLKERKIYLMNRRFKDDKTKEPIGVYGNLEWKEGIIDSDVEFRQADTDTFDTLHARFFFSHLPQNKEALKSPFRPPPYVENCLGIDPYSLRYESKQQSEGSKGAAVNHKFRDLFNTGINKCPTMIYNSRPFHQDIFFEDMIKASVFNRALAQYENRSDKLANYFQDRGYFDWLLPEIGASQNSFRKGDAPSGKGKFLEEGIALINAITNVPIRPDEPYLLERNWMLPLIEDILVFNQRDTHKNDLSMAWIQALIGAAKIMMKKVRNPSELNSAVLDYLLT